MSKQEASLNLVEKTRELSDAFDYYEHSIPDEFKAVLNEHVRATSAFVLECIKEDLDCE